MRMDKYVAFIQQILQQAVNKRIFKTQSERSLYEKGYLIGLLASLAQQDSDVLHKLRRKYERDGGSGRN